IAALTAPGGKVVVLTVNRWAPITIVSSLIPFRFHHGIKRLVWKTESKDTFPVAYRMNTRRELAQVFEEFGFEEIYFDYIDDCRASSRFRVLHFLELSLWRLLRTLGLNYPENCLLGVYERVATSGVELT